MQQLAALGSAAIQLDPKSGHLDVEAGAHGGRMGALTLKEAGDLLAALAIGFAALAEQRCATLD